MLIIILKMVTQRRYHYRCFSSLLPLNICYWHKLLPKLKQESWSFYRMLWMVLAIWRSGSAVWDHLWTDRYFLEFMFFVVDCLCIQVVFRFRWCSWIGSSWLWGWCWCNLWVWLCHLRSWVFVRIVLPRLLCWTNFVVRWFVGVYLVFDWCHTRWTCQLHCIRSSAQTRLVSSNSWT